MVPFLGGGLLPQGGLKVVSFLSKRKGERTVRRAFGKEGRVEG